MAVGQLTAIYDEVAKCNKCGFCLPTCPVYRVTSFERSAARGHNAYVRNVIEGRLPLDADTKEGLFECLMCRACVANCFPAVQTDEIVAAGRAAYVEGHGQPALQQLIFRRLLPNPTLMANVVRVVSLGKRSGLSRLAKAMGILRWFGRDLPAAEGLVDDVPLRFLVDRLPSRSLRPPAAATQRFAYFVGCGFNYVLPHVAEATLRVLLQQKSEVEVLPNVCCGLPPYSYGDREAARILARKNMRLAAAVGADAIVTECGSCSSFLKHYPQLFPADSAERAEAEAFASRVRDVNEVLADLPGVAGTRPLAGTVTYHDPCHLSRYQKITAQPRRLLQALPGLTYRELPEADWCCGGAGTFNLTHYEQSMGVLSRKMANVRQTEATILSTSCPACLIQLAHGVRQHGLDVELAHVMQLIARSYESLPALAPRSSVDKPAGV